MQQQKATHAAETLNPQQREAVMSTDPMLVIAGAGTGKTRVITHKIAHLIRNCGLQPNRILAITFTKKAANEMRKRVQKMTSIAPRHISTFHALCVKILRQNAGLLDNRLNGSFTIYDEQDSRKLVKEIMQGTDKEAPDSDDVDYARDIISSVKQDYCTDPAKAIEELPHPQNTYAWIARQYQERLLDSNAMDFDDLQQHAYAVLLRYPAVKRHWSGMFDFVLVDEFQDTNGIQEKIMNALKGEKAGICAVGDPQQTIFAWRGAEPGNIFHFSSRYNAREVKLEQNYRSGSNILDVANHTISHITEDWKDKVLTLWTDKPDKGACHIDRYRTDEEEATGIADKIQDLASNGYAYGDVAILCRLSHTMKGIEKALIRNNIPYQTVGGVAFHQKPEVKDMMAYLRVLANPRDKAAFFRAVNTPPRSVGKQTIAAITLRYQGDWLTTAESMGFTGERMREFNHFIEMMRQVSAYAEQKPYDALMEILKQTNYEAHIAKKYKRDYDDRMGNVSELGNMLKQAQDDALTLSEFLDDSTLTAAQDTIANDNCVKIMTVHAAKGLEFPAVFVTALEENMFPSYRALEQKESTDEERRCFYVAVTRGMRILRLSYAKERVKFGNTVENETSRYVTEIRKMEQAAAKKADFTIRMPLVPPPQENPGIIERFTQVLRAVGLW